MDGGFKATVTGIEADGSPVNFSYAAQLDGNYYAVSGTQPTDSIAFRRTNPRRLESTRKVNGKVQGNSTFALSRNGRVVTLTFTLLGGKPGNVLVFEK